MNTTYQKAAKKTSAHMLMGKFFISVLIFAGLSTALKAQDPRTFFLKKDKISELLRNDLFKRLIFQPYMENPSECRSGINLICYVLDKEGEPLRDIPAFLLENPNPANCIEGPLIFGNLELTRSNILKMLNIREGTALPDFKSIQLTESKDFANYLIYELKIITTADVARTPAGGVSQVNPCPPAKPELIAPLFKKKSSAGKVK